MSTQPPGLYSPREAIFVALFDRVSQAAKYKTTDRKLKLWGDVPPEQRPCLFQHEVDDDVTGGEGGTPQKITMHVNFFIYTNAKVAVPASLLNPLIDSLFQVLQPSAMTGKQNLGLAYVDHCWISGKIFKDAGDLDGDGMAVIPVSIVTGTGLLYPR